MKYPKQRYWAVWDHAGRVTQRTSSAARLMPIALGMQRGTKEQLKAASREILFKGLTASGLLLGMAWGLNNPPSPTRPASCSTADCVSHEIAATTSASILAVVGPALIGAMIGMAVAAVLVMALLRPARTTGPTMGGTWMGARFAGRCSACRAPIAKGDPILHVARHRTLCANCGRA